MTPLKPTALQFDFARRLLEPTLPAPPKGLVTLIDNASLAQRYAVYRNNIATSLIDALAESFPAVHKLVGCAFFRATALSFVRAQPPTSPLLLDYGGMFPDFLRDFPPAISLPYLSDIAALEWAKIEAFHASDQSPLDLVQLAAQSPNQLFEQNLLLHPATRLVESNFSILSLWKDVIQSADAKDFTPFDLQQPEDVLITRPEWEVCAFILPPGGADFIRAIDAGANLGRAAALAEQGAEEKADDMIREQTSITEFDFTALLTLAFSAGAFIALS